MIEKERTWAIVGRTLLVLFIILAIWWTVDYAVERGKANAAAERKEEAAKLFEIAEQSQELITGVLNQTEPAARDSANVVYREWYDSLEKAVTDGQ